jgi:hypothetical protein
MEDGDRVTRARLRGPQPSVGGRETFVSRGQRQRSDIILHFRHQGLGGEMSGFEGLSLRLVARNVRFERVRVKSVTKLIDIDLIRY